MSQRYLLLLLLHLPILYFQYKTTTPTKFLYQTEMDRVEQISLMHQYPPHAYRLANIIEARPEFRVYFKLEKNFINIFNIQKIILIPFFLVGYFEILKKYPQQILFITLLPVILLTFIGHQNLYGPISLYPVFYSATIYGFTKICQKLTLK